MTTFRYESKVSARFLLAGIAVIYLLLLLANVFGASIPPQSKTLAADCLLGLALLAVGLHIAGVVISRSGPAAMIAMGSIGLISFLLLRGLMIVTGDSL